MTAKNGKLLTELRTEIELGMKVYPSTNPDIYVDRAGEGNYRIVAVLRGGAPMVMGYGTLDDLITDDIARIASQPVWSTTKPQTLIERMQSWGFENSAISQPDSED